MKYLSLKKSTIFFLIAAIAGSIGILSSCVKKDFDQPPVIVPHVSFTSNMTIENLKLFYILSPHATLDTLQITQDTIIQGVINSTDESGNIYKNLYIQDETGGIVLTIDQGGLSAEYKLGQRVFIKCKGLYMGTYGGMVEIGYGVFTSSSGSKSIGRIPSDLLASHIFLDGFPGAPPAPIVIDPRSATLLKYACMLVEVPKAMFPEAPAPFVIDPTPNGAATNRNVADSSGALYTNGSQNFIVRTSNFANFAADLLPYGVGTLRGILTVFNNQFQMAVRDRNDLVNFPNIPPAPALYENNFNTDPADWVKYSSAGSNWTFDGTAPSFMYANGYSGTAPTNCYLISPGIDLTGVTETVLTFKTYTNYSDNGLANPFEVMISTDYSGSGDPTLANWSPVSCTLPPANSGVWTPSGNVDLSMYNQKVYIMFHYRSSGTTGSTASKWEVDDFRITGTK